MKAESWTLAFGLFRRALPLDDEERRRLLDTSCAGQPLLRREVERMLAEDAREGGLLDHGFPPLVPAASPAATPERIGAYAIRREIASGGMGTVYEAEQERPRRTVALKTLRPDVMSANGVKRFRLEGEVLGSLQHPGIAQVFEAGTFGPEETPFLTMEYVPGGHDLVSWATERGLGIAARLELFLRVCDAVHHGHQRGVVHRDLKPSNVLVDPAGMPKVIDFGLARLTESARHRVTMVETGPGRVLGTLPYMSPEQLDASSSSGDADVLGDVYSLGVVLFELLAGELPHDLRDQGLGPMVATLREVPPRRLREVAPALPAELEWITSRAMEPERERRYASVHELAKDLRRFLRHEPVLAGPPGTLYRLRKLVRRHRVAFTAAALVLAIAAAGAASTWTNVVRAQRNLEERNVQLEVANAANGFLTRVLEALRPNPSGEREPTLRDFIDEAAEELAVSPPEVPAVEAQVRSTLATTYESLGDHDEAEIQYEAGRKLAREAWGENDPRVLELEIRRLRNLYSKGPLERAREEATATADAWERALGPDHPTTLAARRLVGLCLWKEIRHEEAEALLSDVVARLPEPGVDTGLAFAAYTSLAQVLVDMRRWDEALAVYDELVERGERRPVADADEPQLFFEMNLATLKIHAGRVDEGVAVYRAIVPVLCANYGTENPFVMAQAGKLARLLVERGEHLDEAEALIEELLEIARRIRGSEFLEQVFGILNAADALNRLERHAEAEELARAALEANERLFPEGTLESLRTYRILGTALGRQGKLDEADEVLSEGLDRAVEKLDVGDPLVAELESELLWVDGRR